jgi:hypothetical protein
LFSSLRHIVKSGSIGIKIFIVDSLSKGIIKFMADSKHMNDKVIKEIFNFIGGLNLKPVKVRSVRDLINKTVISKLERKT